ncbi:hypothetical protein P280DRAFT_392327, partial [Massarina eburnea CBS 473.64]
QDFDDHIANLRSQLQYFNQALESTDHNAPDWLATELLSLRNKSGRLQDDMQRFRNQLESEGLATMTKKKSNKRQRLSLEDGNLSPPQNEHHKRNSLTSQHPPTSPPNIPTSPPTANQALPPQDSYVGQHMDVSDEVNRRLQENRLRRLMATPSTSQKRKYDVFEDATMSSGPETEDGRENVLEKNTAKKIRVSGSFGGRIQGIDGVLKRGIDDGAGGGGSSHGEFKRRRR